MSVPTPKAAMLPLLVVLFVLSGAAGLFYEAVWSRYLSLFVGHDAYARVITLVIFLGGMGIGALVVSARSARLKDPLMAYAMVEAIIGLVGLVFHDTIYQPVVGWAYESVFPALGGGPLLLAFQWALAGLLILPQSILLGATFPLMTAGALRRLPREPGNTLSILYFANSLGAASGVLIAGFWLYAAAGLPGTLAAAAILNLVVALGSIMAAKAWAVPALGTEAMTGSGDDEVRVETGRRSRLADTDVAGRLGLRGLTRLLLALAAGTAIASFVYEVAWIRMLSLVLGSSTHAFELMLSAFILGLSLGSLWIRHRSDRLDDPLRTLVIVQIVMGGLAVASLPLYVESFGWISAILAAVARTPDGYIAFTVSRYAVCLAIMLPATFCAGMTLPLMTRMLLQAGAGERAIGAVYSANTLGSIVGAALTGLSLLPLLGLKITLIFGAVLDMALGLLAAWGLSLAGRPARRLAVVGAGIVTAGAALVLFALPWDQRLLMSGVFRTGRSTISRDREILFHADGRTATVHASLIRSSGYKILSTNGKADGSLSSKWFQVCNPDSTSPFTGDDGAQALLALIALSHAPDSRLAAVIGYGTGMSSHFLLGSRALQELVTIEIEPAMVRGARQFYPANRRVFDDPRSTVAYDDARAYFAASKRKFELLLSEPSNPWVSGVSGLFTVEFYAQAKRYLTPDGIFAQWVQTYEMNDDLVLSVLAGIHEQFGDYRVFLVSDNDLLIVATPAQRLPLPDWTVFSWPAVKADLCAVGPVTDAALDRLAILDRMGVAPLLDGNTGTNSDFYPSLDLGAERARFLARRAAGFASVGEGVLPFVSLTKAGAEDLDLKQGNALEQISTVRRLQVANLLRRDAAASGIDDERYQVTQWMGSLSAPTASWRAWTRDFWAVFRLTHVHPLGPDSALFARAAGYAGAHGAPEPVRGVIEFAAALAERNYVKAADAAQRLVAEAGAGRSWVPTDDLLDGAVLSLAATGRGEEAQQAFDLLRKYSARPAGDLRQALLKSYADRARIGTQTP
jgi:predicted membrane-bound spermidine synthase